MHYIAIHAANTQQSRQLSLQEYAQPNLQQRNTFSNLYSNTCRTSQYIQQSIQLNIMHPRGAALSSDSCPWSLTAFAKGLAMHLHLGNVPAKARLLCISNPTGRGAWALLVFGRQPAPFANDLRVCVTCCLRIWMFCDAVNAWFCSTTAWHDVWLWCDVSLPCLRCRSLLHVPVASLSCMSLSLVFLACLSSISLLHLSILLDFVTCLSSMSLLQVFLAGVFLLRVMSYTCESKARQKLLRERVSRCKIVILLCRAQPSTGIVCADGAKMSNYRTG